MPLQKLEFRPGVNRETTNYANEGGFFVSEKVRFRGGFAQKIGGWQNITSSGGTYNGVARYVWNYVTLQSQNLLAIGTTQKLYMEFGGIFHDITPIRTTATLGSDPIDTTSGSKLVVITATSHGATVGTYITISGATAVGGITLSGEYEIVGVASANTFSVIASTAASSTATGGGAAVVVQYQINAGPAVSTTAIGWGGGPWGFGAWGSSIPVGVSMRLWSILNYGDDCLFAEREGNIYYWTDDVATWSRAVTFKTKIDTVPKVSTTATFASGSTTIVVSDATGINTGSVIAGSGIPTGAYVTTAWTGSTSLTLSAATTGSGTVAVTASYSGEHAPNKTMTINLSPIRDFLICLGAKPYDPTNFNTEFDPLLVRWSDQGNPYEWVPELTNQSGEQRLSNGSFIVTSTSTRQEILILTDTAVYAMQYVGPPFVWNFNLLDQDISVASQNSVIAVNNSVYWMGEDKFFVYDGRVQTLPCSLRQHVFSTLNRSQISQVMCGINEPYSEIWWFYPGTGSQVNSLYVTFNYQDGTWHYGSLNRTAFVQQTLRSFPMLAKSVQTSYLSSNISATDTTITLLNAGSYPSEGAIVIENEEIIYTGISGNSLTGCVRGVNNTIAASHSIYSIVAMKAPNQVMFHEIGWDNLETGIAEPITAFIETSDFDIGDGNNFSFVSRIIPDVKFLGSSNGTPSVTLSLYPHNYPGAAYGTPDVDPVNALAVLPVERYTEQVYTRIRGRQLALRVTSSGLGVAWQMGAMRLDIRPDGRR
jgi:hypothetical protein